MVFDCDDADPEVRPGLPDDYADGVDQDCDGADGTGNPLGTSQLIDGARFNAGHAVATLDFDADGVIDIAVSEPLTAKVFLFLGAGSLATARDVGDADIVFQGNASGGFGWSLASAGDVDGDGRDDLIVGAPYGGGDTGVAYVFLAADVPAVPSTVSTEDASWTFRTDMTTAYLGTAVAGLGDIDGDGLSDVAIGAPGWPRPGSVYVFLARDLRAMAQEIDVDTSASHRIGYRETHAEFGAALAAGDVNGDGVNELLIGAEGVSKAFLFRGNALHSGETSWSTDARWTFEGGYTLGGAVALGDVDGDGLHDAVLGSRGGAPVYVFLASSLNDPAEILQTDDADAVLQVEPDVWDIGWAVCVVPDLDGDGADEIAVGSGGPPTGDPHDMGRTYIVSGKRARHEASIDLASAELILDGLSSEDLAGAALAPLPDRDGDGRGGLVLGAPGHPVGGETRGGVYVWE